MKTSRELLEFIINNKPSDFQTSASEILDERIKIKRTSMIAEVAAKIFGKEIEKKDDDSDDDKPEDGDDKKKKDVKEEIDFDASLEDLENKNV